jgi:hypothetical protein
MIVSQVRFHPDEAGPTSASLPARPSAARPRKERLPPDFEPYYDDEPDQIVSQATTPERGLEMAAQLAEQLRLPLRHQLYVMVLL